MELTSLTRLVGRARRARRVGIRGLAQRLAQRMYLKTGAAELSFNLALEDVLGTVPRALPEPAHRPPRGIPLQIGWVCTPPAPGSGGHTTLFRMVEALEAHGHRCTVLLYDKHGVDVGAATARIRTHWPRMAAEIRDVTEAPTDLDAVVASGWETAHVIVRYITRPVRRFYFMQDYEPYFYGHGAERELAEMTYRLPFRRIALGEMLEAMFVDATGADCYVVPFGCDGAAYGLPAVEVRRSGIVFFSRPDFPRRGYQIAVGALLRFHEQHPEQEIHVFGTTPRGLTIPHTFHGRLSVPELNDLYGRTIAGLAMSFTNITLVAEEMLAAGNIPIVNEMESAHRVLTSPHVRWAEPVAEALAAELNAAVSATDIQRRAQRAADSVSDRSWEPTQAAVVRIIEDDVYEEGEDI